jgi:hypothetical protein
MADDPIDSSTPNGDAPVRSTQSVLLVLAAILVVPIVALLIAFMPVGGSGAGDSVVDAVDSDRVQAVYLTNDLVYFGIVTEPSGDFFTLQDAFFLRGAEEEGNEGEDSEPRLVPVPVSQEVGGEGDLLVNANEVLRIQALAKDSEIAAAIDVTED